MNYTKGEWEVNKVNTFEGEEVYAIHAYPEPTRIQRVANVFLEANANLIAAAPDMYEALKLALDETPKEPLGEDIKRLIRQALAKAEGGDIQ